MIIALFVASPQCGIVTMTCLWVPGGPSKAVAIDPYLQTLHYRIELKRHLVHKHLDIKNLSCCLETSALPGSQPEHSSDWCYCNTVTSQNLAERIQIQGFLFLELLNALLSTCVILQKATCWAEVCWWFSKRNFIDLYWREDLNAGWWAVFTWIGKQPSRNHSEHPSNSRLFVNRFYSM